MFFCSFADRGCENMKKVCIQGLGFVGIAMSVAVADASDSRNNEHYFSVTGIDIKNEEGEKRVNAVNRGEMPFLCEDNSLIDTLKKTVQSGNLKATTDESAYGEADVIIVDINLDLISGDDKNTVSWDGFQRAIQTFALKMKEDTLVVIETTVPPGTCENVIYPIIKSSFEKRGFDYKKILLAHSYERVMPGKDYLNSIKNFWRVYSGINVQSAQRCAEFLEKVINVDEFPLIRLHSTTASEMAKVLENSYRAVNIAFIDEWSRLAENIGVDLFQVIQAIKIRPTHSNIMHPGFGVGGYCLTKDPLFGEIASRDIFNNSTMDFPISKLAVEINKNMPNNTVHLLEDVLGSLKDKKLLLLGVSYRQDIGDTRHAPSEIFYKAVKEKGASIKAHDPYVPYWEEVNGNMLTELPDVFGFDAIVFAVPHVDYKHIDFKKWVGDNKICIVDANNVLTERQRNDILRLNLVFKSIGRGVEGANG